MSEDSPTPPYSGDVDMVPPAEDMLTYATYLKVSELTDLQEVLSEPPMHDELLFIVIHQAYELWFKQILFELDEIIERLGAGDIFESRRLLERVISIEKLLVQQIHVLETMMPRDFASFRSILNPASGFQSVRFRGGGGVGGGGGGG
ncbi:MAG: tryptophan 2,3-dioxygenase family protein, partial [Myxococcota bacterium]